MYFAEQLQPDVIDVFYASLDGGTPGAPKRLNEGSSVERDAIDYTLLFLDNERIVYGQRDVTDGPVRMNIVSVDGSQGPMPVSPEDVDVISGWVWVAN